MNLKFLFGLSFLILSPMAMAQTTIPADDPRIQTTGRFDLSNPKAPRFDWAGAAFDVRYKGKSLGFLLEDGKNNYDVYVDGKLVSTWVTQAPQTLYSVEGLSKVKHIIHVVKRTEALWGIATFKGLVLSKGGTLFEPPARPKRKIEVVGDSFVAGYGDEATTLKCSDLRPYQNADKAFGGFLARDLKAEYQNISYSGRGIVRNYGEKARTSPEPFPPLYDRTLCGVPQSRWDFSKWGPDAVIIHLGDNDFSTEPRADSKNYEANYLKFLKHLRGNYPQASIFLFAPNGWPNFRPFVEDIVRTRNEAGDKKVYFVGYGEIPQEDLGCDWHPQVKAQRKFADILIPVLKEKLGWN